MGSGAMLVLTTCGNTEEAAGLAASLVDARLAACVNCVDGVTSTYRWRGARQTDEEVLLLIKTTEDRLEALQAKIRELSSYELPEVLAVRVDGGLPAYLDWLRGAAASQE
jgi:periplasmic divalent cation tolerance protein